MLIIIYFLFLIVIAYRALKDYSKAIIFYLLLKPFLLNSMVLYGSLTFERAILIILALLFIPYLLNGKVNRNRELRGRKIIMPINLLIFLSIINLIGFTVESFTNKLPVFIANLLDFYLIIYLLYFSLKRSDLNSLIRGYSIVFFVISVYGILTVIFNSNPYLDFFTQIDKSLGRQNIIINAADKARFGIFGRLNAVFYHTISYGGHLALISPLLLLEFLNPNSKFKTFYLTTFFLLFVNVLLTNTRTAILFFIVANLFILANVNTFKRIFKWKYIIAIISFTFIILLMNPGYFNTLRASIFFWESSTSWSSDIRGSSIDLRYDQILTAYNVFTSSPLFGHGAGVTRSMQELGSWGTIGGAESVWIVLMIDYGLLGIIIYSSVLWLFFLRALNYYRSFQDPIIKLTSLAMIGTTIGYSAFISATGIMRTETFFLTIMIIYLFSIKVKVSKLRINN